MSLEGDVVNGLDFASLGIEKSLAKLVNANHKLAHLRRTFGGGQPHEEVFVETLQILVG